METVELITCITTGAYLLVMAVLDIKSRRIPLQPGMILLVVITGLSIPFAADIVSRLLGVAVGAFLYIVSKISRGEVGEADAFVYAVTGMTIGIYHNVEVLLVSLFFAAIVSAFLLVIKRVDRKYKLPFIPFTFAGYVVVMVLTELI
ncbi:MAG: prepilin peptidase [Eubacterium sp.]|nr:prepilin peptidase [Eubacterium sp.]